jgi:protein-tyrosine phosphatase
MIQPIKYCYWVEPNKLIAGEYHRDKDEDTSKKKIKALLASGIRVFIDLTEENEGLEPYSFMINGASHFRFPIRDQSIPQSFDLTVTILDAIDRQIDDGKLVYVHCRGGIGRTGVIVGCWLARHGLGGKKALYRLNELWQECPKSVFRESPESFEQEEYIRSWKVGQ